MPKYKNSTTHPVELLLLGTICFGVGWIANLSLVETFKAADTFNKLLLLALTVFICWQFPTPSHPMRMNLTIMIFMAFGAACSRFQSEQETGSGSWALVWAVGVYTIIAASFLPGMLYKPQLNRRPSLRHTQNTRSRR